MRPALYLALLALFLTACGQTGPLYLPEEVPAKSLAEPSHSPEPVTP